MANFSKLCITDAGKRLLNLKLNAGDELSFVEMVMSERKYDMAVLEELTGLEGIRQRADIWTGRMIRTSTLSVKEENCIEDRKMKSTAGLTHTHSITS